MIVLAVNCGSSSLKFQLLEVTRAGELRRARGLVERIGTDATLTFEPQAGPSRRETLPVADHDAAVARMLAWLRESDAPMPDAVGHRIVHGGARFTEPTVIDASLVTALEALTELAPLHNAPGVAGIRACRRQLPSETPMVAVFDTSFHADLPEVAYRYAIPTALADRHGIRRYGFHGLSYRHVVARYAELSHRSPASVDMIALHLGNGSSISAIRGGRSVDTSMGFTPLEGLVMGTRSGDLDPAIVGVLAERERVSVAEVERWLNERSGLYGLSGTSRDMRDLLTRAGDDPRARLAVDVFCYRARKYIGAYLAALGGSGALVFTGGIGAGSPVIREGICANMGWCGLILDPGRNSAAIDVEARISADGSSIEAFVIPADEERVIALDTARCLSERRP